VLLPEECVAALKRYIASRNGYASQSGIATRINFGQPGVFWRSCPDKPWMPWAAASTIRRASARACAKEFGPHAIRRYTAQQALTTTVAEAMGWKSVTTLDKHYRPRAGSSVPAGTTGVTRSENGEKSIASTKKP